MATINIKVLSRTFTTVGKEWNPRRSQHFQDILRLCEFFCDYKKQWHSSVLKYLDVVYQPDPIAKHQITIINQLNARESYQFRNGTDISLSLQKCIPLCSPTIYLTLQSLKLTTDTLTLNVANLISCLSCISLGIYISRSLVCTTSYNII